MLTALACGFAFGEDWGEGKTLESTLAGKGNEERDWEIHDADDIERLLNLLKVSVVDRRRMGWE